MSSLDKFIRLIVDTFPNDRLTYQKGIPTFHPASRSEAAKLISLANTTRQKLYITGFGNNIDPLGSAFENLIVLRTDFLGQLIEVNESGLSIVVGSGFPLREINAKLESAGLFLPIGELPYVGSVGGAVSIGLSAYLNSQHWEQKTAEGKNTKGAKGIAAPQISVERYILRLDVATPTGEEKSFGVATAKHPSGENFARVFSPSWGLFGFIASVKFRVAPLSAKVEYQDMREIEISQQQFLKTISQPDSAAAQYFSQVRRKFDPQGLFPIIPSDK